MQFSLTGMSFFKIQGCAFKNVTYLSMGLLDSWWTVFLKRIKFDRRTRDILLYTPHSLPSWSNPGGYITLRGSSGCPVQKPPRCYNIFNEIRKKIRCSWNCSYSLKPECFSPSQRTSALQVCVPPWLLICFSSSQLINHPGGTKPCRTPSFHFNSEA